MWRISRETQRERVMHTLMHHLQAHPENQIWQAGQQRNHASPRDECGVKLLEGVVDAATHWYLGWNKGLTCFPHGGIHPCSETTSLLVFVADLAPRLARQAGLRELAARIAGSYFWDHPNQQILCLAPPSQQKQPIPPIRRSELGL